MTNSEQIVQNAKDDLERYSYSLPMGSEIIVYHSFRRHTAELLSQLEAKEKETKERSSVLSELEKMLAHLTELNKILVEALEKVAKLKKYASNSARYKKTQHNHKSQGWIMVSLREEVFEFINKALDQVRNK